MEFREKQAIYMQIADYFRNNIIKDIWKAEEKVPSIRQLAVDLEVNPNTIMRTYTYLQERNIIYNKRGIGYFVTADAKEVELNIIRKRFLEKDLPIIFSSMKVLSMSLKEIEEVYKEWLKDNDLTDSK